MIYFVLWLSISIAIYSTIRCWILYKDNVEMNNIIQEQARLLNRMLKERKK